MYKNMMDLKAEDPQGHVIRNLMAMSNDVVKECEKTMATLKASNFIHAKTALRSFITYVKSVVDMTGDTLPLSVHDVATTEKFLDDATDIVNKTIHGDVRGWEQQSNQKQDALIAVQNFKTYWKKKSVTLTKAYLNPHTTSKRLSYAGLPNYRFKIGQRVVTKTGNKSGKIVGIQREGGTGRQMYNVKLDSEDMAKSFSSSDLSRED